MLATVGLVVFVVVEAIAADVEPQVAGEGEEPLHGLPVEFSGVLGDVRGYVAEPVGFVSRADQVPQRCGAGLEDGEEPV